MRDDIRIQFSQKGIIPEDYNYHISDYKTQTSEDSKATGSLWDEKSVTVEAWGKGNNSSLSGIVCNNYDLDTLAQSANMEKSEIISELINAIADENDINNINIIRVSDEISLINPYELLGIEYDESLDEQEESISQTTVSTEAVPEDTIEDTIEDATEDTTVDTTEDTTVDTTEDTTVDTTEDTTVDTTEDATVDTTEDTTVDTTEDATVDTTEDATVDTTEDATVDTTEDTTVDTTETTETVPKDTTPDTTETTEAVPEDTTPDTTEPQLETTAPQGENIVKTETYWYSQLSAAEQDLENAICKLTNAKKEKIAINESINRIQQGTYINTHDVYERTNITPKQVLIEGLQKQEDIIDSANKEIKDANKEIKDAKKRIEEAKKEIERQRRSQFISDAAQYLGQGTDAMYKEMKWNGGAWCHVFVDHVLGLSSDDKIPSWYNDLRKNVKNGWGMDHPEGCTYTFNFVNNNDLYNDVMIDNIGEVKPGDLIMQDWGNDGGKDHIGIVTNVEVNPAGGYFVTAIEGNANHAVRYVKYELNENGISSTRYEVDENGEKLNNNLPKKSGAKVYFFSMALG